MKYQIEIKGIIAIIILILLLIIISAGWFYWFQWRPTDIRSDCGKQAREKAKEPELLEGAVKVYDAIYKTCLREHGLEK